MEEKRFQRKKSGDDGGLSSPERLGQFAVKREKRGGDRSIRFTRRELDSIVIAAS